MMVRAEMIRQRVRLAVGLSLAVAFGCTGDDERPGAQGDDRDAAANGASEGGPPPFTPPGGVGKGELLVTASGESLASQGYPFPPRSADDAQFYDGWQVTFDRLLVTFDAITLADNPDKSPGDQAETGAVVATLRGPWAIDLAHDDPSYQAGDNGGRAIPFAAFRKRNDGSAFATDGRRYAFGYAIVAANARAINVNLGQAALDDYQVMIDQGCSVLYVGTATFRGDKTDPSCYPSDRASWPDRIAFRLCFRSPTTYQNCQNPSNDGEPLGDEESQRGIALFDSKKATAQITLHTDHPFWDGVLHESPAHFDQFAARARTREGAPAEVTLEDTTGVDYTAFSDREGHPIAWRYCSLPPTNVHPKFTGTMGFDPQSVPHAAGDDPAEGLRDYRDFATYNQSTQGHLNADGLCAVKRNYPSPP